MLENYKRLKKALSKGDIVYNSNGIKNKYTILKENLNEIIKEWENMYSEIKKELSKWEDMDINGELDFS